MGVQQCDRAGCERIMCERYNQRFGYICYDCHRELEQLVEESKEPLDVKKFMETRKTEQVVKVFETSQLYDIFPLR